MKTLNNLFYLFAISKDLQIGYDGTSDYGVCSDQIKESLGGSLIFTVEKECILIIHTSTEKVSVLAKIVASTDENKNAEDIMFLYAWATYFNKKGKQEIVNLIKEIIYILIDPFIIGFEEGSKNIKKFVKTKNKERKRRKRIIQDDKKPKIETTKYVTQNGNLLSPVNGKFYYTDKDNNILIETTRKEYYWAQRKLQKF